MLESVIRPGVVAIVAGVLVSITAAVPFIALEYRRFGRLTFRSTVAGLAIAVYGSAIATYTLLPLPDGGDLVCTSVQPVPFRFVADVLRLGVGSPGAIARNAAVQQVLLNVVLFLPLGVILRRLLGWRVLAVGAAGLGVSLLVEATQVTGIWTLYPCAYRVGDVDDLIANTAGALLGALAAPLLGRRRPPIAPPDERPTTVSLGRRLTGMVCDVVAVGAVGVLASLLWSALLALSGTSLDPPPSALLSWITGSAVPAALQLGFLLVSGQTVGEQVVRLQPVLRPSAPRTLARWAFGIGGWTVLGDAALLPLLLTLVSLVALVATSDRRGLAYAVAGLRVRVSPPPTP